MASSRGFGGKNESTEGSEGMSLPLGPKRCPYKHILKVRRPWRAWDKCCGWLEMVRFVKGLAEKES